MNNYGESCIMTWPLGAVKRWDIFWENWNLEVELRSNGASTTQNCLENTTARKLEYDYFKTIGRFTLRDF